MRRVPHLLLLLAVATIGLAGPTGCYYLQLGAGQTDILLRSEAMDRAMYDAHREKERLDAFDGEDADAASVARHETIDRVVASFDRIADVRRFASEELGLVENANYTVYFDTGAIDRYPTVVVSAAPKDRLESVRFTFPIVGSLPYKGFFDEAQAEVAARELLAEGYDVYVRGVAAYSTIGTFTDPVFTPMLGWSEVGLIGLIVHEMTHATVWRAGDADFNESLAVFCERQGAIEYLESRFGPADERVEEARNRFHDQDAFSEWMGHFESGLRAYFAQPLPRSELIAGREEVYDAYRAKYVEWRREGRFATGRYDGLVLRTELDNAQIMTLLTYNRGTELYDRVTQAAGGRIADAIPVFRDAASADGDPRQWLEDWLAERTGEPEPGA